MTLIEAVYESGVFRPVEPIHLPEQTRVRISFENSNWETEEPPADEFFTAANRMRLSVLMAQWRQSRDAGTAFPKSDQVELDALVNAELRGTIARSEAALRGAAH